MSTRAAEKKAHRAAAAWGACSVVLAVDASTGDAPMWLRVLVGLLSLLFSFFAGLVAIPNDKAQR